MDFTLKIFQNLLNNFLQNHYRFLTFYDYIYGSLNSKNLSSQFTNSTPKLIILRHDVDRKPEKALKMAKIEHK